MRLLPPGYSASWPLLSAYRRRFTRWWSSQSYQAEDAATGKRGEPVAIMDFSEDRYAGG